jgi:hypothetical protein
MNLCRYWASTEIQLHRRRRDGGHWLCNLSDQRPIERRAQNVFDRRDPKLNESQVYYQRSQIPRYPAKFFSGQGYISLFGFGLDAV